MNQKLTKRQIAARHIHKRILSQLVIFALVSLAMIGFVTYDALTQHINLLWIVGSLIISIPIGLLLGRIFAITWHEDTQKVILNMDKMSFLLIGVYIVFRFASKALFGEFLHGEELTVVTFSSLSGILIGRGVGMLRTIMAVLRTQNIL